MRLLDFVAASNLTASLTFAAPTNIDLRNVDKRTIDNPFLMSPAAPTDTSKSTSLSSSSITSMSSTITATTTSATGASHSQAQTGTPTYIQTVSGGWSFAGCVAEPFFNGVPGQRALTDYSSAGDTMTVVNCATFCNSHSSEFFAVEYSSQCFCGNALQNGASLDHTNNNCQLPCAGNADEYCGGSAHMCLYAVNAAGLASASALPTTYSSAASSPTATASSGSSGTTSTSGPASSTASSISSATPSHVVASALASASGYSYALCAVEPFHNIFGGPRIFPNYDFVSNTTSMSVEMCARICASGSYTYMGVEYADECYCGNSIEAGATEDTTGACNMACPGNPAELCGGAARMNLYALSGSAVTLATTYVTHSTSATAGSGASSTATSAASTTAANGATTSGASSGISTPTTASVKTSTSTSTGATSTSAALLTATGQSVSLISASTTLTATTAAGASTAAASCLPQSVDTTQCASIKQSFPLFGNYQYNMYYKGVGFTEARSNPANQWSALLPPITKSIASSYDACQAATMCMYSGGLLSVVYHSFDLHWHTKRCEWECVLYAGQNTVPSYFNVNNASTVTYGFGFSGSSS